MEHLKKQIILKKIEVLRTRDWSFILLIGIVTAVCIRLGFWQLDRLDQRQAEIEHINARLEVAPANLATPMIAPAYAYRRAAATGEFDPGQQILLENRSLDGQPGFHLITPLRFKRGEGAVLVDRGWIAYEDGIEGQLDNFDVSGLVEVTGILIPSVDQPTWDFLADPISEDGDPPLTTWRFLTIDLIQKQVSYPLAPLILVQTKPLGSGPDLPQPDPGVELDEGPHLGYAIQWFAFAAIAITGGGLWIRLQLIKTRNRARVA